MFGLKKKSQNFTTLVARAIDIYIEASLAAVFINKSSSILKWSKQVHENSKAS